MTAVWNLKNEFEKYINQDIFDCYLAEALLSEGRYTPTLEKALKDYNVGSLDALAEKQQIALSRMPKLQKLYSDVEMPLVRVLWNMEKEGIRLDTERLEHTGMEILKKANLLKKEILEKIGFEINLNSAQQVGNYLAEKEGVPLGKTRTGKFATNELELSKFKNQFEIIQKILEYRTLTKLNSTYVDSLISKIDPYGRIHTTYHQVYINTGRLASSNPNLQNIPVTSEFGLKIKSCFEAKTDHKLVSFDYSQQELRILAHVSEEEKLIEAFKKNEDVHKLTAGQIFNVPIDKVTPSQRRIGKTINFGIIYGMSGYGMSESLQIPVEDAEAFIKNFYANFPKIKEYYDSYLQEGKIHDFVETILGRRRYVFENPKRRLIDNATRRILMNYPIQGSAADLIKLAMVEIDRKILQKHKDVHLLLQIHDDLVFEIKDDGNLTEKIAAIKNIMCNIYPLKVPVEVDIKTGTRWGEMEPFRK